MSVHAHGYEPLKEVFVDVHSNQISRLHGRDRSSFSTYRVRFTLEEALTLQRQLGVAIGEAAGQQTLDGLEQKPYTAKLWMEPATGKELFLVYNRAGCAVGGPWPSLEEAEAAAERMAVTACSS